MNFTTPTTTPDGKQITTRMHAVAELQLLSKELTLQQEHAQDLIHTKRMRVFNTMEDRSGRLAEQEKELDTLGATKRNWHQGLVVRTSETPSFKQLTEIDIEVLNEPIDVQLAHLREKIVIVTNQIQKLGVLLSTFSDALPDGNLEKIESALEEPALQLEPGEDEVASRIELNLASTKTDDAYQELRRVYLELDSFSAAEELDKDHGKFTDRMSSPGRFYIESHIAKTVAKAAEYKKKARSLPTNRLKKTTKIAEENLLAVSEGGTSADSPKNESFLE